MQAKPSNQLELELASEEKAPQGASIPAEADVGTSTGAVLLSFSAKHQQRAADEERRLLDAIGERAAHLLHFLRKSPE
jgi:hypothetical protein